MKFNDIIGHASVKSRLKAMIDEDRMPHALLLSGPPGVGKLALARALAQYMHCNSHTHGDSCGVCPACLQHQSFNNADIHFTFPYIKKKSEGLLKCADYAAPWREFLTQSPYGNWQQWLDICNAGNSQPVIYVEESTEIVRRMNMSNYAARYKIVLLWLPEKLQTEAANKLLKIIEEPFDDTRFILVSNEPQNILPTIYSRTQRVELSRLSVDEIAEALTHYHAVDPHSAADIAIRSEGSIAAAIELIATGGEHAEFAPLFRDMMRKAYSRDVKGLRTLGDEIAAMGREKSRRYLAYCCSMVRENFIYNLQCPQLNSMDREEELFSSRFSPFVNAANAEILLKAFTSAASDISRNASAKIVMFDTLLHLIIALRMTP